MYSSRRYLMIRDFRFMEIWLIIGCRYFNNCQCQRTCFTHAHCYSAELKCTPANYHRKKNANKIEWPLEAFRIFPLISEIICQVVYLQMQLFTSLTWEVMSDGLFIFWYDWVVWHFAGSWKNVGEYICRTQHNGIFVRKKSALSHCN